MSLSLFEEAKAHAKRAFDEYARDHEMTVFLDQGVYRHLRFISPKTSVGWFEIVTSPNLLTVHGDLGNFSFSRLDDMFEFFRGREINPDYWSQKVQSVDRHSAITEFSPEHAKAWIDEELEDFDTSALLSRDKESYEIDLHDVKEDAEDYRTFVDNVETFFQNYIAPHEQYARDLPEFRSVSEYSHRFLLCLWCIVYAIESYDQNKKR